MSTGTTTAKEGEISKEMVNLNDKAGTLHNRLRALLDRLAEILREATPSETEKRQRQEYSCEFANILENITNSFTEDIESIDDALNRLEI